MIVTVPTSVGELVDKITILRIKSEKISDPQQLSNVQRELSLLEVQYISLGIKTNDIKLLEHELTEINRELWDIEDGVRECEKYGDFGQNFINLARSVYKTNDIRASIKKKINVLVGSTLIEEKSYA